MERTGSLKVAWVADEGRIVNPGEVLIRFDYTEALVSLEQSQNTFIT